MRTTIIHPYEQSEENRRRRYSPLYICLCLLCTVLLVGAIVGAILLGIFLSKSDTDSTTSKNTTRTITSKTSTMTSTTMTSTATTTTTTTTTDPPCMTTCSADQQCVKGVCVGTGALSFTLTWSRTGDGDIVVRTPDNKFIHYSNKNASVNTSGGQLDVDDRKGTGPENVFWAANSTTPPTGTYNVCFAQYNFTIPASTANPITATVKIEKPPNPPKTVSKIFTSVIDKYDACDSTSDQFVTSIDYP